MLTTIGRNQRALSPIFATLIILAIVTVLFIPVFIWTTSLSTQSQDSWKNSGVVATERIVVEEVSLMASQTNCVIYVRNIGDTAVTINDVIIETPGSQVFTYEKLKGELTTKDPSTNVNKDSIIKGQLIAISIDNLKGLELILTHGQVYMIKVFTSRGVSDQFQVEA